MNLPEVTAEYSPQVIVRGNPEAKILIVGEAPGKTEVEKGIPFVGASGQELGNMLAEAGISEADCLFTNVINIRPANNLIANFFATSKKKAAEIGAIAHSGKYALQSCTKESKPFASSLNRPSLTWWWPVVTSHSGLVPARSE